jgi:predicted ATP-dependent endonuclease of OLD family
MIDLEKSHASLVRLVKEQDNITTTYQVHFDLFDSEDKNYLQMINRFNPHVCETFFAQRIVLVEGDTEAVFYREIIRRYYPDKKIYILNTGSKANMVFYQKILTHFGISHIVVHDADVRTYKNENGKATPNPMFSCNEAIWKQIEESNKSIPKLARRFVHFKDFETAHGYKINMADGKPLSAYKFALGISKNNDLPCFKFLNDLFGENKINMTQEELQRTVDAL